MADKIKIKISPKPKPGLIAVPKPKVPLVIEKLPEPLKKRFPVRRTA